MQPPTHGADGQEAGASSKGTLQQPQLHGNQRLLEERAAAHRKERAMWGARG